MKYIFCRSYAEALKIGVNPEKSFIVNKDGNIIYGFTVEKHPVKNKEKNHGRDKIRV